MSLLAVVLCTTILLTGHLGGPRAACQEEAADELFAFPPRTPERLIRAAVLANKLDRPVLARGYLATFLESLPGRDSLNAIRKQIGISVFLKLSSTERLHPESQKVLAAINEAFPYPQLSPSSIAGLVDSLGQSPEVTTDASLALMAAGPDAVVPLLNAAPDTEAGRIADQLLLRYPNRFTDGLLAALQVADNPQKTVILKYLAGTGNQGIIFHILPLQFSGDRAVAEAASKTLGSLKADKYVGISKSEAAKILVEQSVASLTTASHPRPEAIEVEEAGSTVAESQPSDDLGDLQTALDLATNAIALNDSVAAQGTKFAVEAAMNSWPAQWPDISPDLPTASPASADDQPAAAAIAVALQSRCTASLLVILKDAQKTANILAAEPALRRQCLVYHDPRVRLLAAAALWNQKERPDRTEDIIQSVASGTRKPQAVVIDPRVGEGSVAAGVLRQLGYNVDFERTGREGFSTAANQMQCELVLVHSNCLQWPLSVTLANLRSDYRTAGVPIVIYGPESHRMNVARKVDADANLWFETEPLNDNTTGPSMQLQKVSAPRLTEAEREAMIRFALNLANDN